MAFNSATTVAFTGSRCQGGLREHIDDVPYADGFVQSGLQLQETPRIPGDDNLTARRDDSGALARLQLRAHGRVAHVVAPGTPATDLRLGHLAQLEAGDGPQQLTRSR